MPGKLTRFAAAFCPDSVPDDRRMSADHSDVWAAWQEAERSLKEVEHITGQLCVPAVNELRYAGTHFLRAAQDETADVERDEELWKALRHCKRAIYDCYEYGCLHSIEKFEKFKQTWEPCLNHFPVVFTSPSYPEICDEIDKVKVTLTEVDRGENGNRDSYAGQAREGMLSLRDVNELLEKRVPEIAAMAAAEKKKIRREIIFVVFGILATILFTAVSIVFAFLLAK